MNETPSPSSGAAIPRRSPPEFREVVSDALVYWEKKRLMYNAVLATTCVAVWWTSGLPSLSGGRILGLLMAGVGANICFCTAYLPDVFIQMSDFREAWRRRRWMLFAGGLCLAVLIALPMATSIFHVPPGSG